MKKLVSIIVLICCVLTLKAQQVSVNDLKVHLTMMGGQMQGDSVELAVTCQINGMVAGSKIVLLGGSTKDNQDAGKVQGTMNLVQGKWIFYPSDIHYNSGIVKIPFWILKSKQSKLRYFTLYVEDTKGSTVSNKLYYQMP
jgi:hypothetical protein